LLSGAKISLGPLLQSVLITGSLQVKASTNTFGNPSLFDENRNISAFDKNLYGFFCFPSRKLYFLN